MDSVYSLAIMVFIPKMVKDSARILNSAFGNIGLCFGQLPVKLCDGQIIMTISP